MALGDHLSPHQNVCAPNTEISQYSAGRVFTLRSVAVHAADLCLRKETSDLRFNSLGAETKGFEHGRTALRTSQRYIRSKTAEMAAEFLMDPMPSKTHGAISTGGNVAALAA